ncbi:MIP family channel protein [Rhodoblastus acidophilus]|uniref:MIP family channel protein n=1 Tax=Candidatus Rhodoblastus alkanivorans TaxID=2954117 RepID=A0ABS9Z847_9HYPH|nr:MIP family channel protein [Candidatus Rhodoblastus alkanivorans]MCI4680542.1 MIP family channel protein [Candidatus Rhodoblastus alkanivorans]MCI4682807.1 MIP family channel protein [Candidatus Rhodoblastus alkanivorans]MDI4640116.1 MIP family channel protein [Rhodoblastus acidophilus]
MKKYIAEVIGTAALVFFGCGSVTFAGMGDLLGSSTPFAPLAVIAISMAFGLTLAAMAYGVGPVSGCHVNPAVSVGVWVAGRLSTADLVGYIISQCIGAIIGAGVLYLILSGHQGGWDLAKSGLGQNGWSEYSTTSAFIAEFVGTFFFLVVILGATSEKGVTPVAGVAIGVALLVIHINLIRVTGTSVNPARSLGPALFVGGKALAQLWLFIVAPIAGAVAAGALFRAKVIEP